MGLAGFNRWRRTVAAKHEQSDADMRARAEAQRKKNEAAARSAEANRAQKQAEEPPQAAPADETPPDAPAPASEPESAAPTAEELEGMTNIDDLRALADKLGVDYKPFMNGPTVRKRILEHFDPVAETDE